MQFFIYSNKDEVSVKLKEYLISKLESTKCFIFDENNPSLIISIGGDGRFLKSIRKNINRLDKIAFVGISSGKLGYLCDYDASEIDEFIDSLISNEPTYDKRALIEVNYQEQRNYYLNEARIEKVFETLSLEIYVNDIYLEKFAGNGLNVSSSTGSGAYNRSLGGPLLDPNMNLLILGEISPINNIYHRGLNSFVVLNDSAVIKIKGKFNNCFLGGDNVYQMIDNSIDNEITFKLSDKHVTLAHYRQFNFVKKIRNSFIEK